jgi:hypothetical protein
MVCGLWQHVVGQAPSGSGKSAAFAVGCLANVDTTLQEPQVTSLTIPIAANDAHPSDLVLHTKAVLANVDATLHEPDVILSTIVDTR